MYCYLNLKSSLLVTLLLCSLSLIAQEHGYRKQSTLPKSLQRFQFGVSTVGATGSFKGNFVSLNTDSTFKSFLNDGPTVSKGGFGVTIGTFHRLALIGKTCAIAWDVNLAYNMMYWKGMGRKFYREEKWNNGANTMQIAMPIGLDLKFGCDARLEKNHRFCTSFGGGIMPAFNRTKLEDSSKKPAKHGKFAATPYIKFETGLFKGICWKLRFTYTFGDMVLLKDAHNWHKENPYGVQDFKLNAKSGFAVSLILMPFSYDWPDNGWWNHSDNHKKMFIRGRR